MRRRLASILLLCAVLCSRGSAEQTAGGQSTRPTFRSSAHLIVHNIIVKDQQGKPITGLAAKDFVVTEDGQPQEIAFVEYQALETAPRSSARATAAASGTSSVDELTRAGVAVPVPGDVKYRGRRLLVLYLDLYNMPFFDQFRLYAAANQFISSQMTPADMVAIMVFQNSRVRLKQEFTDDRELLRHTIQDLQDAADSSERGNLVTLDESGAFGEDDDTFNLFSTDRQLAALQTAAADLGALPELKTLVYFGSGLRLTGTDNLAQLRATVNAAVRANVTINPIDTRGLVAAPPLGDATRASPGGLGMFSGTLSQAATTRQQQSQDTYYALAKDTGGRAMFDNNDLSLGIVQAAQAVTGYYMIGYYTKNPAADGRFRRVKVTLTNNLAADLSYRAGYYGAKDYSTFNATDRERQLEEALRLEDPITDIPMALEVNYFQISSAEYYVPISVRMPGSELTRPRPTGSTHAMIDVIAEIKDEYGVTIRNSKDLVNFTLNAAVAAQAARRPLQYETGFTLLPGSYVIKVLARDTTTGRIGTFQRPFVVPNLERETVRLPISSVVLSTQRVASTDALYTVRQKVSTDAVNPLIHAGQKLIPSVTRTFSAARTLFVLLQAYERDPGKEAVPVRPLAAFVTFYRNGAKVFETELMAIDGGSTPNERALPIRFSISLGGLEPGDYDCQVTVLEPGGARAAFWRAPVVIVR